MESKALFLMAQVVNLRAILPQELPTHLKALHGQLENPP